MSPDMTRFGAASPHAKWILLLLFTGGSTARYNEPIAGRTRLMKELFLLKEVSRISEPFYEFEASHYGPSSKQVLRDLEVLTELGYVQYDPHRFGGSYQLTPEGNLVAQQLDAGLDEQQKQKLAAIKRQFNLMPLNKLLVHVYERFPRYAVSSRIRDEVLRNPDEA